MQKQVLKLIVIIACACLLPSKSLLAQKKNTYESEPVYLGTEEEYKSTLKTMFDENGLRKVEVGFHSNNGELNNKVGLVDKYGKFIVQPIYDEIKLYSFDREHGSQGSTVLPRYFRGGYTQAKRDGKMGLLNIKGEEVIPCQYDFVGLPAEGMCRILNKKNGDDRLWYIGYWDLEKNKEILAPNKYITLYNNNLIGKGYGLVENTPSGDNSNRQKPQGDYLAVHDFIDGHALVFTEYFIFDGVDPSFRATIVDKTGKDVLGKTYLIWGFRFNDFETYPQKGPYLSFNSDEPTVQKQREFVKFDDSEWKAIRDFKTYATGLAGPGGILIKPTYTTGIKCLVETSGQFFINPSDFIIIPKHKVVITQKDAFPKYLYGTGVCLLDFSGKEIIPAANRDLQMIYYETENIITVSNSLYTPTGKKIEKYDGLGFFTNGFANAFKYTGTYNQQKDGTPATFYFVKSDGSSLNLTKLLNWDTYQTDSKTNMEWSKFSTKGYVWVTNNNRKWGLIDFSGKTILPFEYEKVNHSNWSIGDNGYAIVEISGKKGLVNASGKQVVPCNYKDYYNRVGTPENGPVVIVENFDKKEGLVDINTGKFLIPVAYDEIGAFAANHEQNIDYCAMDVYYVKKDGKAILLTKDGKEVFSASPKVVVNEPLSNLTNEAVHGLYSVYSSYIDNRGRIIFPKSLERNLNLEIGDSYTIYIDNGKVYRISANYLSSSYGYKTYTPGKTNPGNAPTANILAKDNNKLAAYEQSKFDAHLKAYQEAKGNSFVQKQVHQKSFVQFQSTPSKVLYNVGETFDDKGFRVMSIDIYDNGTEITSDIELKINNVKISKGYKFVESGEKIVNCYYKGEKLNFFKISVVGEEDNLLADGDYYFQIYDKYIAPVGRSLNWVELSDKKPEKPFTVKLVKVDPEKGPMYKILHDGRTLIQVSGKDGSQLQLMNGFQYWRINQYKDFCTIRDYGKQSLIVNACGEKNINGTKVIVWTSKGKAPENAKIKVIKVN